MISSSKWFRNLYPAPRRLSQLIIFFLLAAILFGAGMVRPTFAQSTLPGWDQPANLSQSGAASQPRVFAGTDGKLQAIWWDSFDGLVTSVSEGSPGQHETPLVWSPPLNAPIQSLALLSMPTIVSDGSGWLHAFWSEANPLEVGTQVLMHSQMPFGGTQWSLPRSVAGSVLTFNISVSPSGELSLAYVRNKHTVEAPAGVYVRRKVDNASDWGAAKLIYESIYFRLLPVEQAWVRVWDAGDNTIYLTWSDPQLGQAFFSSSQDGSGSWSEPELLGQPEDRPVAPRVVGFPDGSVMRIWQASVHSQCTLFLQIYFSPAPEERHLEWSEPIQILQGLPACPQADRFLFIGDQLFWVWGEGSGNLQVSAWDSSRLQWSLPQEISFNFQDIQSHRQVGLTNLHASLTGERLVAIGADAVSNEIWSTAARSDMLDLVYALPSPWAKTVQLSGVGEEVGYPIISMDLAGTAHIVWTKIRVQGSDDTSLMYARLDENGLSTPVAILERGRDGPARHPAMYADGQGRLHLFWVGDVNGRLFYSSAIAQDARSSSAWISPKAITEFGVVGSPQAGMDAAGNLYVLFVVPLNEGRGVYLARSEDGGKNWLPPQIVFDAERAGWQMVDHPSLVIEPDGTLHAAWVEASIPGTLQPLGIFYARSTDHGLSWSDPLIVTGPGFAWPRLGLAQQQFHVIYADMSNNLWHRWVAKEDLAVEGALWSAAARIPGWLGVDLPVGVAVDGYMPDGTLHLVGSGGLSPQQRPLYAYWDGTRWSSLEWFATGVNIGTTTGAVAATRPQGGTLAAAWLAPFDQSMPNQIVLNFVTRSIPEVEQPTPGISQAGPNVPVTGAEEANPTPSPEPTPLPSPTPDLNRRPAPSSSGDISPLALGGGLAALVVFGGLFTLQLRKRQD